MAKPKNINTPPPALRSGQLMSISMSNHKVPDFVEKQNADWTYYGEDNNYPDYLLRCYNRSAKHNAIVNQKAAYVYGKGFEGEDTVVNEEGETLGNIVKKQILDYILFGGFDAEVIRSKAGTKTFLHHVDFSRIRSDKYNEHFFYSEKWANCYEDKYYAIQKQEVVNGKYDYTTYEPFSKEGKGKQLYYFKSYRPSLDTYPLPDYVGAMGYIELDYQIMNYWYNAVKYGFAASHMITFFNGSPAPEEQKKVEDAILSKFTTTDGRKLILNFAENKETGGSEVQKLEHEDLDKQFQILNKTVEQEIYAGHRVNNPELFGIMKNSGLSAGRTDIAVDNELFQSVYVAPVQAIISKALQPLTELLKLKPIVFKPLVLVGIDFVNNTQAWGLLTDDEKRIEIGKDPIMKDKKSIEAENVSNSINSISPLVANKVLESMTDNEIRALAGLKPISGGDVIKSSKPVAQFKKEKSFDLLAGLKKVKTVRPGKFVKSQPLTDYRDVKASEQKFIGIQFASLKDNQKTIIDGLNKGLTPQEIADEMKLPVQKVNGIISGLKERGIINPTTSKPVPKAAEIIDTTESPTANVFVVYSYEWRSGFSDDNSDTSRDFCIQLMQESEQRKASNSLWTREEIEGMTNEMEDSFASDVWENRGGWYTLPGTGTCRPSCRHVWVQNIYINE